MQQHIDTRAYQTEHGIQAQCPTTGDTFIATEVRITQGGIWLLCGVCDAMLNTHEACEPTLPQWHLFEYEVQREH